MKRIHTYVYILKRKRKRKRKKSGSNENIDRFNVNAKKNAEHVFVYTCNLEHSEIFCDFLADRGSTPTGIPPPSLTDASVKHAIFLCSLSLLSTIMIKI